ncbi:PAS domain-containing protein [soil metagenome]
MKHSSSRAFFAYWDAKRGVARAPDRSEIEPGPICKLLGDIFVLSYDSEAGFPFRVAGTRLCALQGRDLKGESFANLFDAESRADVTEIVAVVAEELLVAVAGVTAFTEFGEKAYLELLLLPFATRAHAPISLTGLLAPLGEVRGTLGPLSLTSFRYLAHPVEALRPRVIRRWQAARGLMVYEGLS